MDIRDQMGRIPHSAFNGNTFKSFSSLCEGLARDLEGRRCTLDGEIVCLDSHGRPQFKNLLFRRAEPVFYAFDICGTNMRGQMMRKRCIGFEMEKTLVTYR